MQNARAERLRLILRTRESTPELQKRIDAKYIDIRELHFKQECILTGIVIFCGNAHIFYKCQ